LVRCQKSCESGGITTGWGDWYYKQLVGQWIDIPGVPEGDYIVRVEINVGPIFDEGENRYPNVIQVRIHVPDPRKKVTVERKTSNGRRWNHARRCLVHLDKLRTA
jgi:hypothetical protein